MDLIADIGATNSRCALLDDAGHIARAESFLNSNFDSLQSLLQNFVAAVAPARGALAVAAPIAGDEVDMLNIDWRFSQKQLAEAIGLQSLSVINDFAAVAHALPLLAAGDCRRVGGGQAKPGATRAVIGPGSGLGVATTAMHGDSWTVISGEGGHVTLATLNEVESWLVADHGDSSGHCSAERLLSGPGLVRIYSSLARRAGTEADDLTPARITEAAAQGDELATRTYDVFFGLLGTVAGNLALTVGAQGGIYIAGGIVPRVVDALERSSFRERFAAKGRYRDYLAAIPTAVITAELPAFIGLSALLGYPR